jgi:superfamily II DNA/RNA helicase
MAEVLSQWIIDSEKFEMQRSYHVLDPENFSFLNRQDDFYITLLNRMFFLLEGVENSDYTSRSAELLEVAKGLLIYSDKDTHEFFEGIDKRENMLYVAAVYYLVGYEAIAALLLRRINRDKINNKYGRLIAYLILGAKDDILQINDVDEIKLLKNLELFIGIGIEQKLNEVIQFVNEHCETLTFGSLDEFFDCFILRHILRKFSTDNLWYDLNRADPDTDWSDYVDFSRSQGILQFLPSQRDAINKGLLTYKKAFSLKMPTSAGKSYITELLIYSELKKNPNAKVLYLAPLRSLSHELNERFEKVGEALSFDSFAAYGGNSSTLDSNRLDETGLFITTPEFFASMEGGDEDLLDKFTLVICDEGQLLDSLKRGTNYELLLSRIKSHGVARFLFISAIIPNIEDVNTWLGGSESEVGDSKYRPCEIKLAMAQRNQRDICLHVFAPNLKDVKFDISTFLNRTENIGLNLNSKISISTALGLKSVSAGSTLVFTYSKAGKFGCQRVCDELLSIVNQRRYGEKLIDNRNDVAIRNLTEYVTYQYGAEYPLSMYLCHGFAYHNGGLPQDIREYIEDYYRNRWIKILVSNSTLAEGVNLPIRTLIVYHLRRYNVRTRNWDLIASTEIRNILGRVGRAGREKYGLVILPDDNQEVFDTVVEALQGEKIHAIRGIFYDVIQLLSKNNRELTDEEVNNVLVGIGASSAIDQMIYRHYGEAQDDVVEHSISDSLAFHLSDDDSKKYIRQAFRVRQDRINASISDNEQFSLLKSTGLELEDFMKLETTITEESLVKFITDSVEDNTWLGNVIEVIYTMPTIAPEYEYMSKDIKEVVEDKTEYSAFVRMWLSGSQYWQIANDMELVVDDVMELLNHLQYHFHMRLQGLIRYLAAKYEFTEENLSLLPEFLKYGINKGVHATLIKGGLRDRIALHTISRFLENKDIDCSSPRKIKRGLKPMREQFEFYIDKNAIPQLSKEKIRAWLG